MSAEVKRTEQQCPECHAQCGFCSMYVWIVRELGCCSQWTYGKHRKPKSECALSAKEKDKTCATCGLTQPAGAQGGGRIIVENRVVGVVPRTTPPNPREAHGSGQRSSEKDGNG